MPDRRPRSRTDTRRFGGVDALVDTALQSADGTTPGAGAAMDFVGAHHWRHRPRSRYSLTDPNSPDMVGTVRAANSLSCVAWSSGGHDDRSALQRLQDRPVAGEIGDGEAVDLGVVVPASQGGRRRPPRVLLEGLDLIGAERSALTDEAGCGPG